MNKKGIIGIIILSIIGVLIVGGGATIYYGYNVHVYKTVRICLGEGVDYGIPCEDKQECVDLIREYSNESEEVQRKLKDAPEFLQVKLEEVMDGAVYCDSTCFVKNVRGVNQETYEIEMLDSCNPDETEITLDIHGKEGLEIMNYLKSLEEEN